MVCERRWGTISNIGHIKPKRGGMWSKEGTHGRAPGVTWRHADDLGVDRLRRRHTSLVVSVPHAHSVLHAQSLPSTCISLNTHSLMMSSTTLTLKPSEEPKKAAPGASARKRITTETRTDYMYSVESDPVRERLTPCVREEPLPLSLSLCVYARARVHASVRVRREHAQAVPSPWRAVKAGGSSQD